MFQPPRIPFDHALPLVARVDLTLDGVQVKAGASVVVPEPRLAWTLWRTMQIDCRPAPVAVEPPPPVVDPKPAKRAGHRAGA